MRINPNVCHPNFGRAFTTEEKKAYSSLISDAKKELNIQDTSAIVFDFNVPSEKGYNTGIGTTFSDSMQKFISFVQSMTGISSIQVQPQGKISETNTSPYSGTNYAYGEHIVDLKKLSTPEYASILDEEKISNFAAREWDGDKIINEYRANYGALMHYPFLESAYDNFIEKVEAGDEQALKLNAEFEQFKSDNSSWLQKESLYEVLSLEYGTTDFSKWSETDRKLFDKGYPVDIRTKRIAQLEKEQAEKIEVENFIQFIADKQQKESREMLNSKDIKLYGDCLIGFSQSEMWANPSCFRENLYYGGPDPNCSETNGIQTWGLPALDYTKLGECSEDGDLSKLGEVGKFLYDKYSLFFKRYDGIRMDAAWQFVTPFIYQAVNGNYEEFKLPEINFTIFNIMKAAAKDTLGDKFDEQNPDNIMLELVGMSAGKSREMTLNTYPHLYTTAYAQYDETPKKFLEKGYQDDKFYVGVGCHDNDSLVNMARCNYTSDLHMAGMKRDYNLDTSKLPFEAEEYKKQDEQAKREEDFRTAKFGEIFTSTKQFFTLPDMFGMEERINISGKTSKDNWTIRIPSDYEKFYFSQLSNGFGLNLPKVMATAMGMKKSNNQELIKKCNEAAEILRQKGPTTEEEANIAEAQGKLNNKFEYVS
ncbi:MAG: 4-alpha-glucanotransferase [Candidatus Gastranaerophilales bacterium]|nr:4-alpha-glucanotransferase [Candidatus Gastranaerophilales bacterium]